ncbi:hypothetical protein GJU40_12770 [Bacillus lacus]|uniref:DNA primase n=1 Tax=Metabacillus lacus TaxID=1983721 RepID=A0A7X2J0I0_9BACI|nr:hypothetical protein [Metabacillus lacus]MRX73014.1 hypothetical protein [Metabacillus lacus]
MSKKWTLKLTGSVLAAMLVAGCANDQDPAPPEDNNNMEQETPPADDGGMPGTENDMENDMETDMQDGTDEDGMTEEPILENDDDENNN